MTVPVGDPTRIEKYVPFHSELDALALDAEKFAKIRIGPPWHCRVKELTVPVCVKFELVLVLFQELPVFIVPFTSRVAVGAAVPIPTLPPEALRMMLPTIGLLVPSRVKASLAAVPPESFCPLARPARSTYCEKRSPEVAEKLGTPDPSVIRIEFAKVERPLTAVPDEA